MSSSHESGTQAMNGEKGRRAWQSRTGNFRYADVAYEDVRTDRRRDSISLDHDWLRHFIKGCMHGTP